MYRFFYSTSVRDRKACEIVMAKEGHRLFIDKSVPMSWVCIFSVRSEIL
jgi:hypothetical protein